MTPPTKKPKTAPKPKSKEDRTAAMRLKRLLARRADALQELGHPNAAGRTEGLIYGAARAAEALGVGAGLLRATVEPAEYAPNPKYRACALVGLYCPIALLDASRTNVRVIKARAQHAARSDAAQRGAQQKARQLRDEIDEWSDAIKVKPLPIATLLRAASPMCQRDLRHLPTRV